MMDKNEKLLIGCPVQYARMFISGKWQMGILWNLKNDSLRFTEIKSKLPGISDKSLMQELDFFISKKIVSRKNTIFPTQLITYQLTSVGRSLIPIIATIVEWGYCHLQDEKINPEMSLTPISIIQSIEDDMAE